MEVREEDIFALIDDINALLKKKRVRSRQEIKDKVRLFDKMCREIDDGCFDFFDIYLPWRELADKKFFDEALLILELKKDYTECFLNHPEVFFYIGEVYLKMKDYEKAYESFGKALYYDFEDDDIIYEYREMLRRKLKIDMDY